MQDLTCGKEGSPAEGWEISAQCDLTLFYMQTLDKIAFTLNRGCNGQIAGNWKITPNEQLSFLASVSLIRCRKWDLMKDSEGRLTMTNI